MNSAQATLLIQVGLCLATAFGIAAAILWAYRQGVRDGYHHAWEQGRQFTRFYEKMQAEKRRG